MKIFPLSAAVRDRAFAVFFYSVFLFLHIHFYIVLHNWFGSVVVTFKQAFDGMMRALAQITLLQPFLPSGLLVHHRHEQKNKLFYSSTIHPRLHVVKRDVKDDDEDDEAHVDLFTTCVSIVLSPLTILIKLFVHFSLSVIDRIFAGLLWISLRDHGELQQGEKIVIVGHHRTASWFGFPVDPIASPLGRSAHLQKLSGVSRQQPSTLRSTGSGVTATTRLPRTSIKGQPPTRGPSSNTTQQHHYHQQQQQTPPSRRNHHVKDDDESLSSCSNPIQMKGLLRPIPLRLNNGPLDPSYSPLHSSEGTPLQREEPSSSSRGNGTEPSTRKEPSSSSSPPPLPQQQALSSSSTERRPALVEPQEKENGASGAISSPEPGVGRGGTSAASVPSPPLLLPPPSHLTDHSRALETSLMSHPNTGTDEEDGEREKDAAGHTSHNGCGSSSIQHEFGLATLPYDAPLCNGHLNTCGAHAMPIPPVQFSTQEVIPSYDGCEIIIDWVFQEDFHNRQHQSQSSSSKNESRTPKQTESTSSQCTCSNGVGVLAIVPGLTSDSYSPYIQRFIPYALQAHFNVAVINTRGMHPSSPLTTPRLISGGDTADIRHILYSEFTSDALQKRFPSSSSCSQHPVPHPPDDEENDEHYHNDGEAVGNSKERLVDHTSAAAAAQRKQRKQQKEAAARKKSHDIPVVLVGFSMGGNLIAKLLGEDKEKVQQRCNVVCAMSICSPWSFHTAFQSMNRPLQMLIYQKTLSSGLKRHLLRNQEVLVDASTGKGHGRTAWDFDQAMKVTTVHHFDDAVIVPHHGYRDRHHYYSEAACFPFLKHVRVPLLCLATEDDPICGEPPTLATWTELCRENPNVVHVRFPAGGHLGFLGTPLQELCGLPNPMERVVLTAAIQFVVSHARS